MSQDSDLLQNLVKTIKLAGSALQNIVKEGVSRLMVHFEEWPERYIEMRANLYEETQ